MAICKAGAALHSRCRRHQATQTTERLRQAAADENACINWTFSCEDEASGSDLPLALLFCDRGEQPTSSLRPEYPLTGVKKSRPVN